MIVNIMVLVLEVLYYSLFMKFTKKEGKFINYCILFILVSVLGFILNTRDITNYFILLMFIVFGIKYIVRVKTTMFDFLIVLIMLVFNIIIEATIYVLLFKLIGVNYIITTFVFETIKIGMCLILNNRLHLMYNKIKNLWDNNNFYIRYLFTTLIYIYVIITCILIILKIWR